ncbi:HAD-IA family hydrolase [Mesorhizobium sp.]|uniref:HAD-IA family hydrolase n=1 Tax=Mesorhizobium sp. TaxID=1871066 RepID=UPI000FE3EC2D|nr:HAD-IA family hydrolase [Mesorhizobium sp.]RWA61153.1 MAG: HAD family hydrolase [Mesorhizobium sp.]RWB94023.1 MAG: HAD family hydrolase [Mesorhizobium sp.]RWG81113.1 MAG: HAD family hydrolase [Mesorhizobium sp.]RWK15200.1 MAG: HAD family hydrolase [Mesorhizobium sp.]
MIEAAQALVLDFGGVISKSLFETHQQSEKALGLPPGTLGWRGPFDPDTDSLWRAMQAGEISERDYWYRRAHETGRLVGEDWTTLPEFLQRVRGDDPVSVIRPEALAAIEAATAAGRKLAILSNELDLFYGADFRERLPFLADFDVVIDATYTQVLKPDPRAYLIVTSALGLEPAACVFVDDQFRNVRGALSVGMNAIQFDVRRPAESYSEALRLLGLGAQTEDQHGGA